MAQPLLDRVLLTNDDGIDAPGLAVLEAIAAELAREVWVVAPARDQSGTAQSITVYTPLRVDGRGTLRFAVSGTPGDCVALGIRRLMAGSPPDLVLSGVNRGTNLGAETSFSGTVGAAMTALALGVPAIALSQAYTDGRAVPWETARALGPAVVARLVAQRKAAGQDWAGRVCLSVNFPDCPAAEARPLKLTIQGRGALAGIEAIERVDPRGFTYHWLSFAHDSGVDAEGTERAAVAAGHVSVTPLGLERTDAATLAQLRASLEG